jgi:hypothetical protein
MEKSMAATVCRSLQHLHSNLYLLHGSDGAKSSYSNILLQRSTIIEVHNSVDGLFNDLFSQPAMSLIHEFVITLSKILKSTAKKTCIILCPLELGPLETARLVCLVSIYAIVVENATFENLSTSVRNLARRGYTITTQSINGIETTLKMLCKAIKRHFFEYEVVDGEDLFSDFVDEHLHYACTANGHVYTILPSRLMVFSDPDIIPDDQLWADALTDSGTTRRFSALFYADLLHNLGARLIVNLGRGTAGADAVFEGAGLGYEDGLLLSTCGNPGAAQAGCSTRACTAALRTHDRLVTLARAGRGGIALQCGGGAQFARAGTLVLSLLMELEGLSAGEAEAWLRLTCPQLLGVPPGSRTSEG